jgi:hypothetical protein
MVRIVRLSLDCVEQVLAVPRLERVEHLDRTGPVWLDFGLGNKRLARADRVRVEREDPNAAELWGLGVLEREIGVVAVRRRDLDASLRCREAEMLGQTAGARPLKQDGEITQ